MPLKLFKYLFLDDVQSMAIYSISDVPFSLWNPQPEDLEVLRSFLINFPPDSVESRFSQYIIKVSWCF